MSGWKLKLPSSYYRTGHKLSAATKAKISAALKGRKRKKAPHPHKGHPLSTATRAKISAALKGKPHPGHPISGAARAKISAALTGSHHASHPMPAAVRAKISATLTQLESGPDQAAAAKAKADAKRSQALSARDKLLAKARLPTGAARKRRPWEPWRNPKKRSRYRLVTANVRKRRLGLLRIKRFRHRGPNLHTRLRYHRVWPRRRRRR